MFYICFTADEHWLNIKEEQMSNILNIMTAEEIEEERLALAEMMGDDDMTANDMDRYESYYFDSTDMLTDYHARVL